MCVRVWCSCVCVCVCVCSGTYNVKAKHISSVVDSPPRMGLSALSELKTHLNRQTDRQTDRRHTEEEMTSGGARWWWWWWVAHSVMNLSPGRIFLEST